MFESIVKNSFFKALANVKYGSIDITVPGGKLLHFAGNQPGPQANLHIQDWRVIVNLSLKGDIGFTEDYCRGYWQTTNLSELLSFGMQNDEAFSAFTDGKWWHRQLAKLGYLTKRNTIKGSKSNIEAHYDLGNDFYQLWLDDSMTYSSGLFLKSDDDLKQAQMNKYDRVIENIPLEGSLLEIGCGWGGFAERLQKMARFDYTGITLSRQQHQYAQKRLMSEATVLLEDYRQQQGQYDAIVSIEMLEAVGKQYWPAYFQQIKKLLKPGGKAMIQTIVIDDALFKQYSKGTDMIRTYIFPGGMLPSVKILQQQMAKVGLYCEDCYRFSNSYVKTLSQWLSKFETISKQRLIEMGYTNQFQRLWRFYLAASIASFGTKRTDVVQLKVRHA